MFPLFVFILPLILSVISVFSVFSFVMLFHKIVFPERYLTIGISVILSFAAPYGISVFSSFPEIALQLDGVFAAMQS